ncbi:MAG: ATP-binding cassette domain-containing protein [Spirochaetales bacterium]|nr:ATP-binding cassette domain-containing protein [Spirochaetales bacterium]MCF7937341.1 ATP-binding cassette domain-containing protein [Spirochaetales bacterium]
MLRLDSTTQVFHPGTANENAAIRDVSLDVHEGDFITIIGSNGAGKTTLFNLISGTVLPTAGTVTYRDRDISRVPEYKRASFIGRIFQDPMLGTASNMTLEDNMMISYRKGFRGLRRSLDRKMRAYFRERLSTLEMGLEDRMRDNVGLLSGGQRQAVTLLMMVLSQPGLILLDEHTAALDPTNAEIVLNLTMRFVEEYQLTTMMITHNMAQAIKYGNRLLMMDNGEIILDVSGKEKQSLTVDELVRRFHEIRHRELATDEVLLSE